jgi:hypothetical protein
MACLQNEPTDGRRKNMAMHATQSQNFSPLLSHVLDQSIAATARTTTELDAGTGQQRRAPEELFRQKHGRNKAALPWPRAVSEEGRKEASRNATRPV